MLAHCLVDEIKPTRVYEVHAPPWDWGGPCYIDRLVALGGRLWLRQRHGGLPYANVMPIDAIVALARAYLCSSPAYLIGHAILARPRVLAVVGIDYEAPREMMLLQRGSVEWLCGVAVGMGIDLVVPDTSPLLKGGELYGTAKE